MNELDEDIETEDIDISKTEDIDNTETEDIDVSKNAYIDTSKTEDIDNTKTGDIDISKTENIDNTTTKDKDEDIDKGRNRLIEMFRYSKRWKDKKGNKKKRSIVWIFWDDDHISELCETWVYYDSNYAYTRFEEFHKRSGEVLFTREYKATTSKYKSDTYIDIDELQMFKDFSIKYKATFKTKNMLDKINNKISAINKTNEGLVKLKAEVTKKVELIYEIICKLQDKIYSDDSCLRLVELDEIDAIIDEAIDAVWKTFYENKK